MFFAPKSRVILLGRASKITLLGDLGRGIQEAGGTVRLFLLLRIDRLAMARIRKLLDSGNSHVFEGHSHP